jgi:hypothetical protein
LTTDEIEHGIETLITSVGWFLCIRISGRFVHKLLFHTITRNQRCETNYQGNGQEHKEQCFAIFALTELPQGRTSGRRSAASTSTATAQHGKVGGTMLGSTEISGKLGACITMTDINIFPQHGRGLFIVFPYKGSVVHDHIISTSSSTTTSAGRQGIITAIVAAIIIVVVGRITIIAHGDSLRIVFKKETVSWVFMLGEEDLFRQTKM